MNPSCRRRHVVGAVTVGDQDFLTVPHAKVSLRVHVRAARPQTLNQFGIRYAYGRISFVRGPVGARRPFRNCVFNDEQAASREEAAKISRPLKSWFEGWPDCQGLE
jgi:hypothetical protein